MEVYSFMRKFIWIFTLICLVSLSCLYAADNNITNESITNGNNDNIVVNSFDIFYYESILP